MRTCVRVRVCVCVCRGRVRGGGKKVKNEATTTTKSLRHVRTTLAPLCHNVREEAADRATAHDSRRVTVRTTQSRWHPPTHDKQVRTARKSCVKVTHERDRRVAQHGREAGAAQRGVRGAGGLGWTLLGRVRKTHVGISWHARAQLAGGTTQNYLSRGQKLPPVYVRYYHEHKLHVKQDPDHFHRLRQRTAAIGATARSRHEAGWTARTLLLSQTASAPHALNLPHSHASMPPLIT